MDYQTIQRLLEIRDVPIGDELAHDHHEAGYVLGSLEIDMRKPEVQANLSVRDVLIDDLHPTQFEFDVERLNTLPDIDPDEHLPFVIDLKGELLINDGHHRIIRARRRGDTTIRARVLKMKDMYFDDDLELKVEY